MFSLHPFLSCYFLSLLVYLTTYSEWQSLTASFGAIPDWRFWKTETKRRHTHTHTLPSFETENWTLPYLNTNSRQREDFSGWCLAETDTHTGCSIKRPRSSPMKLHVGIVVNGVTLRQIFLSVIFAVSIIRPVLHVRSVSTPCDVSKCRFR